MKIEEQIQELTKQLELLKAQLNPKSQFDWSESSIEPIEESKMVIEELRNDQDLEELMNVVEEVCEPDLDSFLDIIQQAVGDLSDFDRTYDSSAKKEEMRCNRSSVDKRELKSNPLYPVHPYKSERYEPAQSDTSKQRVNPSRFPKIPLLSIPQVEYESIVSDDTILERAYEKIQQKYLPSGYSEQTRFLDIEKIQRLPKLR